MRITFLTGNWVSLSGGVRVVSIYADLLRKRGHDIFVVCPLPKKTSIFQQIRSVLKGKGFIPDKASGSSHFDNLDVPRQVLNHEAPITSVDLPDADVVVACWWETAEWAAKLPPSKGAKVYFIQHHEIHEYLQVDRVRATYRLPLHKITISRWLADLLKIQYNDDHVSLIPNSVDTAQFHSPPRNKQSVPTVGMMYSTLNWKGCDISLKAFHKAKKTIKNLSLISFGKEKPSSGLALPEGATFIYKPNQNTIKDIYSQCDVWLVGSRSEGFGLPILEAMACRTPIIATPTGAAPELLATGGGILVNQECSESMARAIENICLLSNSKWRAMSDLAFAEATSYTWEDATDLFEEALKEAIELQK
jgi:glycosyltransferase involved in cell wall biosynthesis